jgi:hypothetical protein
LVVIASGTLLSGLFYKAGKLAGRHFYTHLIGTPKDIAEFIATLQNVLREMKIGILRVEKADLEMFSFILTVHEDLDCSGLPDLGHQVCVYDEGSSPVFWRVFPARNSWSRRSTAGVPVNGPAGFPRSSRLDGHDRLLVTSRLHQDLYRR